MSFWKSTSALLGLTLLLVPPTLAQAPARSAGSDIANYLAGRIAQNAGDWAAAADRLRLAQSADPENEALRRRTFLLSLGDGDYKEAVRLARAMGDDGPSYIAGLLVIADEMKRGKPDEAAARLTALPSDGLSRFINPLLMAWLDVAKGDKEAAIAKLKAEKVGDGFAVMQQLQIALIEDMSGDRETAAVHYVAAGEMGMPLRLTLLVGNFHERGGDIDKARKVYTAFQKNNPGTQAVDEALARLATKTKPAPLIGNAEQGLAEALYELAAALQQEKAVEMGLLYARLSTYLDPQQPLARLTLGDLLAARDQHEAALREYAAVEAPQGLRWAAKLRMAETLRQTGRIAEAAKLLDAMAAEQPARTDALMQLGDLYRMDRQPAKALAAYDRAVARIKEPAAGDWALFYARGIAQDTGGDWPAAEASMKQALSLNPTHPSVLNYLGYSYVDRDIDIEAGRALIEQALAQRPKDGFIIDSLAWAKFKQGDYHGAAELLEQAIELEPLDPSISDHLGDVYWALGRKQEARFQWVRAARQADDEGLRKSAQIKLKDGLPDSRTAAAPREEERAP